MEETELDIVLIPLDLLMMGVYHIWLFVCILRTPERTVVGLNALSRKQWVASMMTDPIKNGVLAVQTIRNNIMASTLLATTAITLSSIIGVFASSTANSSNTTSILVYGNKSPLVSSIKYFAILVCFLFAFLCNVQSIRYYAHVSFLITLPTLRDGEQSLAYITRSLNRGSYFWSFGLRAFYLSFPLFLWIFGPIPMFVCSCILLGVLYFLDTTSHMTRHLHSYSIEREDMKNDDIEAFQVNVTITNGVVEQVFTLQQINHKVMVSDARAFLRPRYGFNPNPTLWLSIRFSSNFSERQLEEQALRYETQVAAMQGHVAGLTTEAAEQVADYVQRVMLVTVPQPPNDERK